MGRSSLSYTSLLGSGIPKVAVNLGEPGGDGIDLTAFFEHVDEMADVMRPLLTQPVLGEIMAEFHRSLVASWTSYLGLSADDDSVLAEMLAGALLAVAKAQVLRRPRLDPTVVAKEVELHLAALLVSAG